MSIEMFNQLLIGNHGCLLETIHPFVDISIDITIGINERINLVLCFDFWRKVIGMDEHVLRTCHRCGEEEIFQVHGHEAITQMSI